MARRIATAWWVVIRLLLRLMWIIRCGALMVAPPRRLIRRLLVAWVVLVCWVLAAWGCVVRLVWGRVPWVLPAAWVLLGCVVWVAWVLLGCVA